MAGSCRSIYIDRSWVLLMNKNNNVDCGKPLHKHVEKAKKIIMEETVVQLKRVESAEEICAAE